MIAGDDLNGTEFDLNRIISDSKKFIDSIKSERKEEYDDLLRQIQKLAKKTGEEGDDLMKRLDVFESDLLQDNGTSTHVSDADLVFLKKEIARYRSSL